MLISVILAGGSGTRLWPLSREAYPKQFIPLSQGTSLFQQTLARAAALPLSSAAIVVGNEQHRFLMAEQIRQSAESKAQIILEPNFKGTAPAVALAAVQAIAHYDNDVLMLVMPADHHIPNQAAFQKSIEHAIPAAKAGKLVAFGIKADKPETGYGYIQGSEPFLEHGHNIKRFVEKPDAKRAAEYVASGDYWWNSGIYLCTAGSFLQALLLHAPETYHGARSAIAHAKRDCDFVRPDAAQFAQCIEDSIDYAIMEKTHQGVVLPMQSAWSDVGAWDAIRGLSEADPQGNHQKGNVVTKDNKNAMIYADKRLVVAMGLEDVIVVDTPDALLVMHESQAQQLKSVVTDLKRSHPKQVQFHQRVNRPWGAFESVDAGERFQVKRITVDVGQQLSLQRHHHRSEHWVVVKGTAQVTCGEKVFLLTENQSTYIPIGMSHRLENVGKIPLEIVEIQSGAYLGEDDIERLADQYGRTAEQTLKTP